MVVAVPKVPDTFIGFGAGRGHDLHGFGVLLEGSDNERFLLTEEVQILLPLPRAAERASPPLEPQSSSAATSEPMVSTAGPHSALPASESEPPGPPEPRKRA